jgi:AP-2 complex subunit sigma-1
LSYECTESQLRLRGEVHRVVAARDQKYQSNFVEVGGHRDYSPSALYRSSCCFQFRNYKIVYRRYAGLFFCICVDANDNELAYLEAIHLFVEILGAQRPRFRTDSEDC